MLKITSRLVLSFLIFVGSVVSLRAKAQIVPVASDEPAANAPLGAVDFENITKLLHAGKLGPHMKCELKVRTSKEDRRFSTGPRIVEVLEVVFYPRGFYADTKVKVRFPAELSTFGSKIVSTHWSGAGEDIKIEAHDTLDHWLRFIHDGKGNIVQFTMGNSLSTYPCMKKNE
ncbi:MAG: hypothetical protein H7326_09620 [Bdellovibrionaceae bacterium]|nr:hypothetical protein [Pseudobdellovibrionaceae bacterium]